jgi:hypothetical protein
MNIEMVTRLTKIGGNGPILSYALAHFGIQGFCLGRLLCGDMNANIRLGIATSGYYVLRIIVSAMKNSPAVRCGSAQSVTKVACWRLRSCREITAGRQRSRIPHDEEDSYEMQIKLLRASLAEPSGSSSVAKRVIPEKI